MKVINLVKSDTESKTKKCTFDITFPEIAGSPIYRDHRLMETNGQEWVSGPSRMYEKDGEKKFYNFLTFNSPEEKKVFEDQILKICF